MSTARAERAFDSGEAARSGNRLASIETNCGLAPARALEIGLRVARGAVAMVEPARRCEARIRLLGEFRLSTAEGRSPTITSRRSRGLVAYLVFAPDHAATRERLCGLFWGDRGEAQARASLRQCLLDLKSIISAVGLDLIDFGRERISLNDGAFDTDFAELKRALESDDAAAAGLLASTGAERLLGDLDLDGSFREWVEQTRTRVDRDIGATVVAHLERLEARGDWQTVRRTAEAYAIRDPLDEAVAASAMRADLALGNTTAAHRRFQTIKAALAAEFGAAPGPLLRAVLTPNILNKGDDRGLSGHSSGTAGMQEPLPSIETSPSEPSSRPRIGILPFTILALDERQAEFAAVLQDDLIAGLSKSQLLAVAPRHSTFKVSIGQDPKEKSSPEICGTLGVDYIVLGTIQRIGEVVRFSVQLVRGIDDTSAWSARFSRPLADLFSDLDDITGAIVGALEPAVLEQEEALALKTPQRDLQFWDLFVRGRQLFWRSSAKDVHNAEAILNQALALQPESASALSILAHCKLYDVWVGASKEPEAATLAAYQIALKAVSVSGSDAFAHYTLGVVLSMMNRLAEAEAEQRRALELNPYLAAASGEMGRLLAFAGRVEEAIAYSDRAIAISPNDPHAWLWFRNKALARFVAGDYREAALDAADAVARGPRRFYLHLVLAACYSAGGRMTEARAASKTARSLAREGAGLSSDSTAPSTRTAEVLRVGHPFVDPAHLKKFVEALNWADG